jgi:hypothetical protein
VGGLLETGGRIEEEPDLLGGKPLEIEEVTVGP